MYVTWSAECMLRGQRNACCHGTQTFTRTIRDEDSDAAWAAVRDHVSRQASVFANEHGSYNDLAGLNKLQRVNRFNIIGTRSIGTQDVGAEIVGERAIQHLAIGSFDEADTRPAFGTKAPVRAHRNPTTGAGRRIEKVGEQREGTKTRLPRGPQKDIVISLLTTPICLTISTCWRHCGRKGRP